MFQRGEMRSVSDRVARIQDPGDFAPPASRRCTPGSGSGSARVHLLPQLAGVDPAAPPVEDVPGQGVELLDLEQTAGCGGVAAAPRGTGG
jgi:hypothetical protein